MTMSHARAQSIINGLQTTARKVLNAVPIGEPWTVQQISTELARHGTPVNKEVVMGCLTVLFDHGLVTKRGDVRNMLLTEFVRAPIKDAPPKNTLTISKEEARMPITPTPAQAASKPLDTRIGDLAAALRNAGSKLHEMLNEMADDLDNIAVEVDALGFEGAEAVKKLAALKEIFK